MAPGNKLNFHKAVRWAVGAAGDGGLSVMLSGLSEPVILRSIPWASQRRRQDRHSSRRRAHTNGHRTDNPPPWARQGLPLPSRPHASPRVYESARVRLKRQPGQGLVTLNCSKKMEHSWLVPSILQTISFSMKIPGDPFLTRARRTARRKPSAARASACGGRP